MLDLWEMHGNQLDYAVPQNAHKPLTQEELLPV
jgi:hypothetical protein